jgi:uncharacterized phage-associated protein
VARYFIAVANTTGDWMTNLRLQKLVYYAQAWHLALYSRPLFEGTFEAWIHGPVLPELYRQYRVCGSAPIVALELDDEWLANFRQTQDPDVVEFLDDVADTYMGLTAYELERMTHHEDPWRVARGTLPPDAPSSNPLSEDLMARYYRARLDAEDR